MVVKFKEAVIDCDQAIRLDASNAKLHFRKATALKGLGKIEDAIISLNDGLLLDATSAVALKDRDALVTAKRKLEGVKDLLLCKNYRSALVHLDGLVKDLGSQNREFNLMRVEALLGGGRLEEALNLTNIMVSFLYT